MNKLMLTGNVGQDATVADMNNGNSVINFSLAVSERYKEETRTIWYKCAIFRNDTRIAQYLKKGTKVLVSGKPEVETYQDNQGQFKANLKCIVFEIELLSSQQNNDGSASGNSTNPPIERSNFSIDDKKDYHKTEEEHDDLPF